MSQLTLIEFTKIKNAVEAKKDAALRARGAAKQAKNRLQQDFGVSTVKEGKQKLEELQNEISKNEKEIERRYDAFLKKYGSLLK